LGFLDFDLLDLLDIILVSALLYQLYKLVQGTVAIKIFIGLTSTYLFWKLVGALQMEVLTEILGQFIGVGVLAVIIVFQQEIRKFLLLIGTTSFSNKGEFFNWIAKPKKSVSLDINAIQTAFSSMSKTKTGALIIITRNTELGTYEGSGEKINSKVGAAVLESIFFKNSPLHDGAVIIRKNEVIAARCVLPVSDLVSLPTHMGLRHRSAASITEMTDALALIVSEETGRIAYFKQGRLKENISLADLETYLRRDLKNS
tara:strand:+ start:299 stop:1072 length:774 start_codon:yes stop_codon:yes gene_type:complete